MDMSMTTFYVFLLYRKKNVSKKVRRSRFTENQLIRMYQISLKPEALTAKAM